MTEEVLFPGVAPSPLEVSDLSLDVRVGSLDHISALPSREHLEAFPQPHRTVAGPWEERLEVGQTLL